MAECELLPQCPFFNERMINLPVTTERMKKRLCLTDNSQCARFMVFEALGRDKVPADLFPHQVDRAKAILAAR
jgi:hypothetical protein